jgi:hypothetical protein
MVMVYSKLSPPLSEKHFIIWIEPQRHKPQSQNMGYAHGTNSFTPLNLSVYQTENLLCHLTLAIQSTPLIPVVMSSGQRHPRRRQTTNPSNTIIPPEVHLLTLDRVALETSNVCEISAFVCEPL